MEEQAENGESWVQLLILKTFDGVTLLFGVYLSVSQVDIMPTLGQI